MPAPTNISPATAYRFTTWIDVSLDVSDLSAPYTVWFVKLAAPGETVMSVWAETPAGSNYDTQARVYEGLANANAGTHFLSGNNAPLLVPMTPGLDYYFRVTQIGVGVPDTALNMSVTQAPNNPIPAGSILINDETDGYPLAALSSTTGNVLAYRPFPAGEGGAALPDGTVAIEDAANQVIRVFQVEDNDYVLVNTVIFDLETSGQINTNHNDKFYAGQGDQVFSFNRNGVITGNWGLPVDASIWGLAPSLDDTILYYVQGPGTTALAVKRWDLVNDVALSDLVAGVGGITVRRDIQVMDDGTILVPFENSGTSTLVKRYSPSGTLLNTYTTGTVGGIFDHLVLGFNSTEFIIADQTGTTRFFYQIRLSDGAVIATTESSRFNSGVGAGDERFGSSHSCPVFITPVALQFAGLLVVPPPTDPPTDPLCPCVPVPPTTSRPPGTTKPPPIVHPPPITETIGEQIYCLGGGIVPIQADFLPVETWWGQ